MSQVILIEDNQTLHNLLSVNLTTLLNVELIPRENAFEAISLLKILPKMDLIITRNTVGGEETAEEIVNHIKSNGLDIPIIVLGETSKNVEESCVVFEDPRNWKKVIETAAKLLGINKEALAQKIQPDYVPVSIQYFLSMETTCCDVYIRIKKGPGDYQFVKRFHATDNYQQSNITKYIKQGLKYLYIPSNAKEQFATFVSNFFVAKLDKLDEAETVEEQIELIAESYDIVARQIKELGFTPSTIQLTESVIESIQKTYEAVPQVSPLLYKVINSTSSYIYQLSHMTSLIAAECLKGMHQEGTPKLAEQQKILAYAAFFNDIGLADNDDFCKITEYKVLDELELETDQWDMVFNHALESSIFIKGHPECTDMLSQVIQEHHGSVNGKGFPNYPDQRICELSKVFIIAEDFAREMFKFKNQNNSRPKPIIEELYKKYTTPDLVSIITSLELTLKKNKEK